MFMALAFAANLIQAGGLPPIFAAIHAVCGRSRRATAIAIVLFSTTLLGGGIGPLASGALSDALSAVYGVEGLRYALMTMMASLLPASMAFFCFSNAMPNDLED
jgi:sugar phosphate permease